MGTSPPNSRNDGAAALVAAAGFESFAGIDDFVFFAFGVEGTEGGSAGNVRGTERGVPGIGGSRGKASGTDLFCNFFDPSELSPRDCFGGDKGGKIIC